MQGLPISSFPPTGEDSTASIADQRCLLAFDGWSRDSHVRTRHRRTFAGDAFVSKLCGHCSTTDGRRLLEMKNLNKKPGGRRSNNGEFQ